MVSIVAINDSFQPSPNFRYRVVHLQAELPLDGVQLGSHPLSRSAPVHSEIAFGIRPTEV